MTIYDFVLCFAAYSALGWLGEVIYHSVRARHYVNRGLLMGPCCPLHGAVAMIIATLNRTVAGNIPLLFACAILVVSAGIYVTGSLAQSLFGIRLWDRTRRKFNLGGYVSLESALTLAALGTLAAHYVQPALVSALEHAPESARRVLALLLAGGFVIDAVYTWNALCQLDERLKRLSAALAHVGAHEDACELLDETDLSGSLRRLATLEQRQPEHAVRDALADVRALIHPKNPGRRLLLAFPDMRHSAHDAQLSLLREELASGSGARVGHSLWNTTKRLSRRVAAETGKDVRSFAHGLGFYKLFWVFFISCIIGVVVETLFFMIVYGYLESRTGLLFGPFNPVYGFGAVVMTVCLKQLEKHRDSWVFIGSALIGGGYEALCSLFTELAFGTVSWDYTNEAYSIGGRTSLVVMLFWGVLGVLLIKVVYPAISRFVERIPNRQGKLITWVLVGFMCANMLCSAVVVSRWSARAQGQAPQNAIEAFCDTHYPDQYLKQIYPSMIMLAPVTKQ